MTSGPMGIGVIGAGNISTQYLTNLATFPDVDVRFVADIDVERARSQAETHGVPAAGTVEELLADDGIDIVINLTIPAAHAEVATQALEAGKHVWNEKPITLDTDSAKALLDTAERVGRRVATAPDTFLGAGLQSALRLVASGRIGAPQTAHTMLLNPGPDLWHPSPDFLFAVGAGPLYDLGPYYITALTQFFGPVRRVQSTLGQPRTQRVIGSGPRAGETFPVEVPTHVAALFEFESGQTATSTFSFDSHLKRMQFEVAGLDGTVEVPDPNNFDGDTVLHVAGSEPEAIAPVGASAGRGTGVVELARAIRAGRPERASGKLAYHVLDVMQTTIEAGQKGEAVEVASTFEVVEPLTEDWDPTEATL
ncbi:gfo/Idh/MocA family oxidoreductase [Desertihabitans brevis]|uniref:Gfo/Idh/MocA family oxidoreductase n=1 Tax=Desertihabitans brevis TaxID=2268447 RepID=A0A367YRZ0_9ACTN|nr:Gfo/Idh/MocA family oxidoreductase [Desertihabitans brevis]RCK68560.1 gfo/Idh/MocA family oxidoreductase [Desertihabitans brevis]